MRYLIGFSYDGTDFYGYQKQLNKRTVQGEIETVLSKVLNCKTIINASSRTDAKVHAYNQKAHFDCDKSIDCGKLKNSLNKMLPNDIFVKNIKQVSNHFHARYDVKYKKYIYKINIGEYNPFERNYVYQYNKNLDIDLLKETSSYLIGTHNFKSFTKAVQEEKDYVRTIYEINIVQKNNIIEIELIGNGFLRYMVRNLVGTLITINERKMNPFIIQDIMNKQDRVEAFKTINPEGLYLEDVIYESSI